MHRDSREAGDLFRAHLAMDLAAIWGQVVPVMGRRCAIAGAGHLGASKAAWAGGPWVGGPYQVLEQHRDAGYLDSH